ncbi:NAD(P)-binding protein [Lentithecium fluviatile CBS 122367]|uniref:NAD(P)-binding protein n=1 Tax=Lentithecium fluviatile CBS 122367 TaxID=1168545 RepID=A0A6G1JGB9_9PLEO|nr:NAD(P)-binding protein [Lentithecium fluviatile CBS 122367]
MSSLSNLEGVALVTGATSGIDRETAFVFSEAGCRAVVFADINDKEVEVAAEESKDITSMSSVQKIFDTAVGKFGRIDYFVNLAGMTDFFAKPITNLDLDLFGLVVDVNLRGTIHCLRAVSTTMKAQKLLIYNPSIPRAKRHPVRSLGRGSIVTLSSANSIMPNPLNTSYFLAKYGVIGATKVAALDPALHGIRVNAVLPGTVDTPMIQRIFDKLPALRPLVEQRVPFGGRMVMHDEVAEAVTFLCGPSDTYMTGTGILIDAGLTLMTARLG